MFPDRPICYFIKCPQRALEADAPLNQPTIKCHSLSCLYELQFRVLTTVYQLLRIYGFQHIAYVIISELWSKLESLSVLS